MHFALHSYVLPVLGCMSMLGTALPADYTKAETPVSRGLISAEGTAPVHINRDLDFTPAPKGTATSRRALLVPYTADSLHDDFCSETSPTYSYGSDAAQAADCVAIQKEIQTRDGYFTISPSIFNKSTGWATIATSGTCSFGIKFQVAKDQQKVVFGTNDVLFYIKNYVGNAKNGKIRAEGVISCSNAGVPLLFLDWGMYHS